MVSDCFRPPEGRRKVAVAHLAVAHLFVSLHGLSESGRLRCLRILGRLALTERGRA